PETGRPRYSRCRLGRGGPWPAVTAARTSSRRWPADSTCSAPSSRASPSCPWPRWPPPPGCPGPPRGGCCSPWSAWATSASPSAAPVAPGGQPGLAEGTAELREVRARGWSLTDEQLALGIRSVAAPLRDGDGKVLAALNVTVHAAETPVEVLTGEYLPMLLQT